MRSRPCRSKLQAGPQQAENSLAGNQSRGGEHSRVFDAGLLGIVEAATRSQRSVIQRITPPMKMANVVSNGRYIPTATSMGLLTCIMMSAMPKKIPTMTSGHGHVAADDAHGQGCHQSGLRRREVDDRRTGAPGS